MADVDIFGNIVDADTVEGYVRAILIGPDPTDLEQGWLVAHLAHQERRRGLAARTLPQPKSWPTVSEFDIEAHEQMPAVVIVSPGTLGEPEHDRSVYRVRWRVEIAVAVAGKDEKEGRMLAALYLAAVKGALIQNPTLRAWRDVTAVAATNVITATGHGLANGDAVTFAGLVGGAPLSEGATYHIRDATTNTFKVTTTAGGTALDLTSDMTSGRVSRTPGPVESCRWTGPDDHAFGSTERGSQRAIYGTAFEVTVRDTVNARKGTTAPPPDPYAPPGAYLRQNVAEITVPATEPEDTP